MFHDLWLYVYSYIDFNTALNARHLSKEHRKTYCQPIIDTYIMNNSPLVYEMIYKDNQDKIPIINQDINYSIIHDGYNYTFFNIYNKMKNLYNRNKKIYKSSKILIKTPKNYIVTMSIKNRNKIIILYELTSRNNFFYRVIRRHRNSISSIIKTPYSQMLLDDKHNRCGSLFEYSIKDKDKTRDAFYNRMFYL